MIHIDKTKGDYIIAEWKDEDWSEFKSVTEKLKDDGYKKVGREHDYLNYYEYYIKDSDVKLVTMMCL